MPLTRRQFIFGAGIAAAGLASEQVFKALAQARTFTNSIEYCNSLPRVYNGINPLYAGFADWSPENLQHENNIAGISSSRIDAITAISPQWLDFIENIRDMVNFNNEELVSLFHTIPQYLYGDAALFANLPGPGMTRLINTGDSNGSLMYNHFDFHVLTFHRIPHHLFRFNERDSHLARVLGLMDIRQTFTMDELLNTHTTTDLEFGITVNQTYRSLVNEGGLNRIFEGGNPNIILFSLGQMDSLPGTRERVNYDPGELYLNARTVIQECLARNVVPIIMLPNILDANRDGFFVANPKGMANCCILHRLALEFNIPLINQYPNLASINSIEVSTDEGVYLAGAYGTGLAFNNPFHYSRAGCDPSDENARLNMDKYYSSLPEDNFDRRFGTASNIKTIMQFFSDLIDQGVMEV